MQETKALIERCGCENGCPSCVGMDSRTESAKEDALRLLKMFLGK